MKQTRLFLLGLLALFFGTGPAWAATAFENDAVKPLAGRNVLLLVGPAQSTAAQKTHYHDLLRRSGADPSKYPVYQMTALPNEVAGKLGLGSRAPGYAVLVRWGNPARFGPARVLQPAVTSLSSDADMYVLVYQALQATNQALLAKLPADMAALIPRAELSLERVDFEANGKPFYVVDTNVVVRNSGKVNATGVSVIYLVENPADGSWFELGRHANLEIKAGQTMARDLVRTTHDTPLLNAQKAIQATRYRIKVESAEGTLEKTGDFQPQLLENQD